MGKAKRNTTRDSKYEHYTKIIRATMTTDAWRSLSPKAQALYPWLKLEWHGAQNNNNGNIRFSYRQASRAMGVSRNTAMQAFRELQAKGFIVVTRPGKLGIEGEARGPSYEITELALPGQHVPRHLYRSWKKGSDFPVVQHSANNPEGRNGQKDPSYVLRQTCPKICDVSEEPVPNSETAHPKISDVCGGERPGTVTGFETSLIASTGGQTDVPPILNEAVCPSERTLPVTESLRQAPGVFQ